MLKRRIIAVLTGLTLLVAVAGLSGPVADSFGFDGTTPAHACETPSGSGGGC